MGTSQGVNISFPFVVIAGAAPLLVFGKRGFPRSPAPACIVGTGIPDYSRNDRYFTSVLNRRCPVENGYTEVVR